MIDKGHIQDPVWSGRAVCGRRLPAEHLLSVSEYSEAPPESRCSKCRARQYRPAMLDRWRGETEVRPGRQRCLWEGKI